MVTAFNAWDASTASAPPAPPPLPEPPLPLVPLLLRLFEEKGVNGLRERGRENKPERLLLLLEEVDAEGRSSWASCSGLPRALLKGPSGRLAARLDLRDSGGVLARELEAVVGPLAASATLLTPRESRRPSST